jgi:hypothetical protein
MHGFHASSECELSTEPEPPTRWSSKWNFGLIAMIVLRALAIAAAPLTPVLSPRSGNIGFGSEDIQHREDPARVATRYNMIGIVAVADFAARGGAVLRGQVALHRKRINTPHFAEAPATPPAVEGRQGAHRGG